jgi:hypothetical protein
MIYPAGILKNEKTGRFHTIVFRMAPMPGVGADDMAVQRYKSLGHHTVGFDTLAEARADLAATSGTDRDCVDCGAIWEWNGEGIPAMVRFFNLKQLLTDRATGHDVEVDAA